MQASGSFVVEHGIWVGMQWAVGRGERLEGWGEGVQIVEIYG